MFQCFQLQFLDDLMSLMLRASILYSYFAFQLMENVLLPQMEKEKNFKRILDELEKKMSWKGKTMQLWKKYKREEEYC